MGRRFTDAPGRFLTQHPHYANKLEPFLQSVEAAGGSRTRLLKGAQLLANMSNPELWKWPAPPGIQDFHVLRDAEHVTRRLLKREVFRPSGSEDPEGLISRLPETLGAYRKILTQTLTFARYCYRHHIDPRLVVEIAEYLRPLVGHYPWQRIADLVNALGGQVDPDTLRKAHNHPREAKPADSTLSPF